MPKNIFFLFLLSSVSAAGQTFTNTTTTAIMDTMTVCIPVTVSGLPTTINAGFGLRSACINLTHSDDSHLVIQIQSPDGTTISLASGIGGSGTDFTNTCLAEDGSNGYIVSGTAPFTGTYIPQQSLNIFNNGQNPNGVWKLCVSDTYFGDSGHVYNYNLTFANNPPSDPPPPPVVCTYCTCANSADTCSLLPDMTASTLCIQQNHLEQPGLLKIANATPNIGRGPLEIHGLNNCYCDTTPVPCTISCPPGQQLKHTIIQRIYQHRHGTDTLTHYDRVAGIMTYHPAHHHLHVDDWSWFSLRVKTPNPDPATWPVIGSSTKVSFCLVNSGNCTADPGYCKDTSGNTITMVNIPNAGFGVYNGCGLDQGIYPGYLDVYSEPLDDPILLSNICNGSYYIVSITNPRHNFLESNLNNNWASVPVTLTQQHAPSGATSFNYTVNGLQMTCGNTSPSGTTYLWNYGDGSWDTTYSPTHVFPATGSYTVSLVSLNQCYTQSSQVVRVTGLYAYATADLNFHLYENPVTENSFITYYITEGSLVNLELVDAVGRSIAVLIHETEKQGLQTFSLSGKLSGYPAGTYFLKLSANNKASAVKCLVIH